MAESRIKYLVRGWQVGDDGICRRFSDICDNFSAALGYLQIMAVRNKESAHLKIDSIEAIWNVDEA